MKLEDFLEVFDGSSFTIRHVKRGEGDARAHGWLVEFTADYFTSDSDRLCLLGSADGAFGWGATLSEALDDLTAQHLKRLQCRVESGHVSVREAEAALREFEKRL